MLSTKEVGYVSHSIRDNLIWSYCTQVKFLFEASHCTQSNICNIFHAINKLISYYARWKTNGSLYCIEEKYIGTSILYTRKYFLEVSYNIQGEFIEISHYILYNSLNIKLYTTVVHWIFIVSLIIKTKMFYLKYHINVPKKGSFSLSAREVCCGLHTTQGNFLWSYILLEVV